MEDKALFAGVKILVTGGCGFIGRNLVTRLLKEGAQVTVIDDLTTGDDMIGFDVKFYKASIANRDMVEGLVADNNIVFHLAARNIIASTHNPRDDYETNIGGTLNILMAMREFPNKRMVYTSSASVYGNPRYLPINEDDHINLLTPYAVSKYAAEGYCQSFHENYGVQVSVLRLSNVYGAYQKVGVVAKFMRAALEGRPLEIHGDGLSTRDFTYVDDVVEALIQAAVQPRAVGEVFNIATGIETNIYDLAIDIINLLPEMYDEMLYDVAIKYIDRRDIDAIRRRVLNIEKARRVLGWMPATTLASGLEKTKEWMEKNDR